MAAKGTDQSPVGGEDRVWYFDEDGTLSRARPLARPARLLEWLGLAYAMVALALGLQNWFARREAPTSFAR